MVLQGPKLVASWLAALPERRQEHVRRVAADCSRAVVGYMTGNLLISVIIVYQQAENHLLQPVIMSRTVQLSALAVLVSVLIGVELFGFLGALLAIPVAGVISVISRDLYDSYRGHPKPEPTIGEDQVPVSSPDAPDRSDQDPRPAGTTDSRRP
jgi:predicted PurR-regulated permease PerM